MSPEEKTDAPEPGRASKPRSPNHPAFSLEKAVEKVTALLDRARTSPVAVPIACSYMGVKHTSSTGMRWQAALQEYGLVEADGRGSSKTLKATEAARILVKHHDHSSEEYRRTLRKAALAPKIHQRVWEAFLVDGHLLPDDALQFELSRSQWGFTESAAEAFVTQFRETIAFAGLPGEDGAVKADRESATPGGDDQPKDELPAPPGVQRWKARPVNQNQTTKDIPLPLPTGGTAVLHLPYLLDEDDYDWVTNLLRGLKRSILAPQDESPDQPEDVS